MAGYVDLYLLPVPKKNLTAYRKLANVFGRVIFDHGATEYREFLGDDLFPKGCVSFTKRIRLAPGEVLISSVVGFKSRKHRDKVLKKSFKDPRMQKLMTCDQLFDMKKMVYGGFKTFVEGRSKS